MPRFAVLGHDFPARHWDFLLEAGDFLRSWRLHAEPGLGRTVPAEPSAHHRTMYLDYEGPVSAGRGAVLCWDRGTFEWVRDDESEVVVELSGRRVSGRVVIRQESGVWVWTCDSGGGA